MPMQVPQPMPTGIVAPPQVPPQVPQQPIPITQGNFPQMAPPATGQPGIPQPVAQPQPQPQVQMPAVPYGHTPTGGE